MPVGTDHSCIVRLVIGSQGRRSILRPISPSASITALPSWVTRIDETTLTAVAGPDRLTLRTPAPLYGEDMRHQGAIHRARGRNRFVRADHSPSHEPVPFLPSLEAMLVETEKFWTEWSGRCV